MDGYGFMQWLNYSIVGGGTLHFFSPFPSTILSPHFSSLPPTPSEVGRPLPARGSGQALLSPLRGPEIVFGAFKC